MSPHGPNPSEREESEQERLNRELDTLLGESLGVAEHGFARVEARVTFTALLGVVTTREREVLRMRFEEDMTQAEIAAAIGASQMHVSRIIRAALGRIRRAMTW